MDRRRHDRKPIRLKVTYQSAEALVTEYTTCVSKGGCALVSQRAIETGTRFVFEMYAVGQEQPIEIEGEVVRVQPIEGRRGRFEIGVRYVSGGTQREVLDDVLSRIIVDPNYVLMREHPRIPVNLVAHGTGVPPRFLIRDLSRGGMRIEGKAMPADVSVGAPVGLAVHVLDRRRPFWITGSVVWVHRGTRVLRTRLGVQFGELDLDQRAIVDGLTRLLRPLRLGLGFTTEPGVLALPGITPPAGVASTAGATYNVDEALATIRAAAVSSLCELPYLGLEVVDAIDVKDKSTSLGGRIISRVGLAGDVEAEIIVEVDPEVGANIAWQALGEQVEPGGQRDLVEDALTELVTTLAGSVCDTVEAEALGLEVSAPLSGLPTLHADDRVVHVLLRGLLGTVVLTIVTRAPEPSPWPI